MVIKIKNRKFEEDLEYLLQKLHDTEEFVEAGMEYEEIDGEYAIMLDGEEVSIETERSKATIRTTNKNHPLIKEIIENVREVAK